MSEVGRLWRAVEEPAPPALRAKGCGLCSIGPGPLARAETHWADHKGSLLHRFGLLLFGCLRHVLRSSSRKPRICSDLLD